MERPTLNKALGHHFVLNHELAAEGNRSSKFDVECSLFRVQGVAVGQVFPLLSGFQQETR